METVFSSLGENKGQSVLIMSLLFKALPSPLRLSSIKFLHNFQFYFSPPPQNLATQTINK